MSKEEQVIPFSNGTEAMDWTDRNCEQCKNNPYRYGGKCPVEENFALGFIEGSINLSTAEFIGYTRLNREKNGTFVDLKSRCQKFIDRNDEGDLDNIPDPVPDNQMCLPFELENIEENIAETKPELESISY